jgi:Ferric reductase like transmembrane component
MTPLRILFRWSWPIQLRRLLGLLAFFYVCLHFAVWIGLDHFFGWGRMWKDVLKRPFITVGVLAFVLLIPLAATSTQGMIKRRCQLAAASRPCLRRGRARGPTFSVAGKEGPPGALLLRHRACGVAGVTALGLGKEKARPHPALSQKRNPPPKCGRGRGRRRDISS